VSVDVLLVVEARIASVQLLEQVFAGLEQSHGVTWRTVADREITPDDLRENTVPVIVRTTTPAAHLFARTLTQLGVPYVYYTDDNFWLLDPRTPIGRHYARRSVRRQLEEVVSGAAQVVVSTQPLAQYVSSFNPAVVHLDAAVNLDKYLPPLPRDPERVVMGFAGSIGRRLDLDAAAEVFLSALERHPNLHLEVIGPEVPALAHERVTTFPYLDDYEAYIAFQRGRRWDIGLAPLRGAPVQEYKTDVKYREYGAQGIAGIYQVMRPYAHIRHGETGMLASTPEEWAEAIDRLVTEPELRERIARQARADIEARYALPVVVERWHEFLGTCTTVGASGVDLQTVRSTVASLDFARAANATRLTLLWLYGLDHLWTYGVARTAKRTTRFLARRITGRAGEAEAPGEAQAEK